MSFIMPLICTPTVMRLQIQCCNLRMLQAKRWCCLSGDLLYKKGLIIFCARRSLCSSTIKMCFLLWLVQATWSRRSYGLPRNWVFQEAYFSPGLCAVKSCARSIGRQTFLSCHRCLNRLASQPLNRFLTELRSLYQNNQEFLKF